MHLRYAVFEIANISDLEKEEFLSSFELMHELA